MDFKAPFLLWEIKIDAAIAGMSITEERLNQ